MLAFSDKTNIVRKRRRHPQIDAVLRRFPAQEIGFLIWISQSPSRMASMILPVAPEILQAPGSADRSSTETPRSSFRSRR